MSRSWPSTAVGNDVRRSARPKASASGRWELQNGVKAMFKVITQSRQQRDRAPTEPPLTSPQTLDRVPGEPRASPDVNPAARRQAPRPTAQRRRESDGVGICRLSGFIQERRPRTARSFCAGSREIVHRTPDIPADQGNPCSRPVLSLLWLVATPWLDHPCGTAAHSAHPMINSKLLGDGRSAPDLGLHRCRSRRRRAVDCSWPSSVCARRGGRSAARPPSAARCAAVSMWAGSTR